MKRYILAIAAASFAAVSAIGSTAYPAPQISVISDNTYGGSLDRMSDNGRWAVGHGKSLISDGAYSFPRLYDISSGEIRYLFTPEEENTVAVMTACDVTDDGSVVVGSYDNLPAVWRAATGEWEIVENNHEYVNGQIERVTPDGRLAIGTVRLGDGMFATMRVWDLSASGAKDITPDNLPLPIGPNIDPSTGKLDDLVRQIYAGDISADGSKFTGMVNFSYPDDCWTFVYDMVSRQWWGVGMDVTADGDIYRFERNTPGILYANTGDFIGSSGMLCGELYSDTDNSGIFFCDSDTREITIVSDGAGYTGAVADPLGTIYASKSYEGPMRDWFFKSGKYWYDFSVLASQLWNIDWEAQYAHDGIGLTGTVTNVSDDGLTVIAADYSASPYATYVIRFPAPLPEIVSDFNLLGNYYATPVNNSSFAYLREVKVNFDREVEVSGDYNSVSLLDAEGNVVANSISLQVDAGNPKAVTAIFRNRRLEEGKQYTVVFPAGIACVSGDPERVNDEIRIGYKGRPDAPVAPVVISPVSGSEVARINANSNPVAVRFNSEIAAVDDCKEQMSLYLLDNEGSRELISVLSGSVTGDVLSIFPLLEQRLAYGSRYEVVIPAGIVADISGADPNEEIVISYVGSYIPEGPGVDGVLFEDDFDEGLTNKWMYYDGAPEQEPSDLAASWGFTAGRPWWTVREDDSSTDQSAASHSMFKSPGKADSWMVTSILNIKDDTASLSFKSQSYRDAGDHLKVYVYPSDDIYTVLTSSLVDDMHYYGELVYDEEQTPGSSEELLAGDWKENTVSLAEYAGKNIYIAFVNDNRNKSAVFIDDVRVAMDMKFAVINLTPASVVAESEIDVAGRVQMLAKTESYKGYSIVLDDADGNRVSEIADADAEIEEGWSLDFIMPEPLPITVGKENSYRLSVTLGDETESISASVRDLAIATTKKIVIEEMTGQGCQFCPLGHAALDWIEKDFPGLVLPVELHTYVGDPWNNDRVQMLSSNLGFEAAPTGRVNRGKEILSPMSTDSDNNYVYKNADTWYDHVVSELEVMAPADVAVTSVTYDGTYCVADIDITFALDLENANFNLLVELCEDNLTGFQTNSCWNKENQPALGEWGAGGLYGKQTVLYNYHNVLRNWTGNTFNGTGGLLPADIEAGATYSVTMKVAVPNSVSDILKTHVTAMLIDSESGKILNADRRYTSDPNSVDGLLDGDSDVSADVYSVDGRLVLRNATSSEMHSLPAGLYIRAGRKFIVR